MNRPFIPHRFLTATSLAVSLLLVPALRATSLLTAADELQLESWLGQGDVSFTNIFTKTFGATVDDFHAAVDGKGATFTLMRISGSGPESWGGHGTYDLPSQIIGGYNPLSWSSTGFWNFTPTDAERTAFLFNLTGGTIQRQNLIADAGMYGDTGIYQTSAMAGVGPTFGGGPDLTTYDSYMSYGTAFNMSFGGTSYGQNISVGGNNHFSGNLSVFDIVELEVFAINYTGGDPGSSGGDHVPDATGTLGLLGASLLILAAFRRRVA